MLTSLFVQLGFWTPVSIFILSLILTSLKRKKTHINAMIHDDEKLEIPELDRIIEFD